MLVRKHHHHLRGFLGRLSKVLRRRNVLLLFPQNIACDMQSGSGASKVSSTWTRRDACCAHPPRPTASRTRTRTQKKDEEEEDEEKHAGEETASEISSFSSLNVKPPNPWKVDVHSEANRISFDFARARDGVVQKIEQLHRQATERFHRTHQKHDREAKRMKETIEKLEKEVQKKTEI